MTRFYTEYELKKQDMKLNEDLFQNSEKFKEDLKVAINEENHRSNVDRAKKKSCAQYFDYDKFHQMVLGADLKGMKLDDVIKIEPDNFTKELFLELFNVDTIDADLFTGLILNIGLYLKETKEKIKNDKNVFLFDCIDVLEKMKYFQKFKMFIGKKHKSPYIELLNNKEFIDSIPNAEEIINKIIK